MKTIQVMARSNKMPIEKIWEVMTDIEKYPQRVKFVKNVTVYGTGEGSEWEDITTILWIPLKIRHTIMSMKKNKEYSFSIPLYLGGKMIQKYAIMKEDEKTVLIKGIVSYDLGNTLLNWTIGAILSKRLKDMLISSIRFVNAEVVS